MELEIRNEPAIRVAALRHIGPYPEIGEAFGKVGKWAGERGIPIEGMIGIYYDNPQVTPPSELRSDACVAVGEGTRIDGEGLREDTVAGGPYAVTVHIGSYATLGQSWGRFMGELVPQSGREWSGGPCVEVYIDDCAKVPEDRLRTELRMPLKAG